MPADVRQRKNPRKKRAKGVSLALVLGIGAGVLVIFGIAIVGAIFALRPTRLATSSTDAAGGGSASSPAAANAGVLSDTIYYEKNYQFQIQIPHKWKSYRLQTAEDIEHQRRIEGGAIPPSPVAAEDGSFSAGERVFDPQHGSTFATYLVVAVVKDDGQGIDAQRLPFSPPFPGERILEKTTVTVSGYDARQVAMEDASGLIAKRRFEYCVGPIEGNYHHLSFWPNGHSNQQNLEWTQAVVGSYRAPAVRPASPAVSPSP